MTRGGGATSLPQGPAKAETVRRMFDRIAPRYDLLNRILTFGLDVRWRRLAVQRLELGAGSLVVDLACGTGDFCRELNAAGLRPVGVDFAAGMLAHAATDAPLVRGDVLSLPLSDGVADGATCGFALRNVTDVNAAFAETARVVRPGGRVAFLEVAEPRGRLLRAGHTVWFRGLVPLIGAVLSDAAAYRYLPRSTAYLPGAQELLAMLAGCGFEDVTESPLGLGAARLITGTRV